MFIFGFIRLNPKKINVSLKPIYFESFSSCIFESCKNIVDLYMNKVQNSFVKPNSIFPPYIFPTREVAN